MHWSVLLQLHASSDKDYFYKEAVASNLEETLEKDDEPT